MHIKHASCIRLRVPCVRPRHARVISARNMRSHPRHPRACEKILIFPHNFHLACCVCAVTLLPLTTAIFPSAQRYLRTRASDIARKRAAIFSFAQLWMIGIGCGCPARVVIPSDSVRIKRSDITCKRNDIAFGGDITSKQPHSRLRLPQPTHSVDIIVQSTISSEHGEDIITQ